MCIRDSVYLNNTPRSSTLLIYLAIPNLALFSFWCDDSYTINKKNCSQRSKKASEQVFYRKLKKWEICKKPQKEVFFRNYLVLNVILRLICQLLPYRLHPITVGQLLSQRYNRLLQSTLPLPDQGFRYPPQQVLVSQWFLYNGQQLPLHFQLIHHVRLLSQVALQHRQTL